MSWLGQTLRNLRERREQRKAKRLALEAAFKEFVAESGKTVPPAPRYPEAALYRHAWRRAAARVYIFQQLGDEGKVKHYAAFCDLARQRYEPIAPVSLAGAVRLSFTRDQLMSYAARELTMLYPAPAEAHPADRGGSVYLGVDEQGRHYVGKTLGPPEARYLQHFRDKSGPYKGTARPVEWRVIETRVALEKLDQREAYYIGFYDSYGFGHNETSGNDYNAYRRGQEDRRGRKLLLRKDRSE